MTARLLAASVACLLFLALLPACSSDAPDDAVGGLSNEGVDGDVKSRAVRVDDDPLTGNSASDLMAAAGPADDEFGAAPPLKEKEMPPLARRRDEREAPRSERDLERPASTPDREIVFRPTGVPREEGFIAAPPSLDGERPRRPDEPRENPFADLPGDEALADRPEREVARERERPAGADLPEDEFAAAPPVAVTDAAGPILGRDEPVRGDDAPLEAPYWPRFHGPKGDNMSTDKGLLEQWPDGGPTLVWTATGIGSGYSSISTANGLIYTAGNKDGSTVISAIDLAGQLQWQVQNGPAWTESFEGTRGTPTIDGDRLYHQSPLGNIVCLEAETGKQVWATNSLGRFGGENIMWALAESLLIDGDRLICCPGGSEASVAALNKLTGETVWKADPSGDKAGYSSPTLVEYGTLRMIFVMTAKAVIGVNADSGKLLFRHPFETQYDVNVLKPIFYDGKLFVSGGYATTGSQLLKLNIEGQNASAELVWESKDLDNHHGGVLLLDGYLYGAAHKFNNAKWVCLDWQTGELKWAERGIGKGSLTFADGMLYMMSEKSKVGLAKPTPEGLEVISDFRLPPGGSGASWAHPVVCGGRLYLRHADRLFAYDVRAGA